MFHIAGEWIPVVSGLVGAAGAIIAQIVTSIAAGRRDTRAHAARNAEFQALTFRDEKRDLFIRIERLFAQQVQSYEHRINAAAERNDNSFFDNPLADQWDDLNAEINVLAADVIKPLRRAMKTMQGIEASLFEMDIDTARGGLGSLRHDRLAMIKAMRASLGVPDVD